MKIFFDGGCRPNPGRIHTAVVVAGRVYFRGDLGTGDNNDAEWLALMHAVEHARASDFEDIVLLGDSAFVVDQVNGRGSSRRFADRVAAIRASTACLPGLRIKRLPRSQNLAGIALERVHGKL